MTEYPLFGIGLQGKSPNIASMFRQNLYYEIQPQGDRTSIAVYGTPGLDSFIDLGSNPSRGSIVVGDLKYSVNGSTLYEINPAGVSTSRGTLLSSNGSVYLAYNGTQIMIVDGIYGYIYTISTVTLVQITDGDFPANPGSVTYQNTYFIVTQSTTGRFYLSASNNGLAWDALDFVTAEGSPDNLIRGEADHGELVLFGGDSIEFYGDNGAQDFPYSRIQGANLEWGLAAKDSVAKFDNSLIFLAKNTLGQVVVVRMNGYQPQRVSTFELESIINSYSNTANATGFSYMESGHSFYQINFQDESWLYDGASDVWSKVASDGNGRHRANSCVSFAGMRLVADYENGNIYELKSDTYSDNGTPIRRILRGRHVTKDDAWLCIDRLQLTMETGVGLATGQGSNPVAMLRWSKDGGHNYSTEVSASIGAIGEYTNRCMWSRLGRARDWVFEIVITDPIKVAISGANIKAR